MRTLSALLAILLVSATPALAGEGHAPSEPEPHAEEGASSPDLQPGESWSFNVTEAGTFDYHCHPHPWMLGQLTVLASNGSAPQVHVINFTEPEGEDFEAWTFSPQSLEVRVGDTVTWVNAGSVMHRITQTVGEHIAHVGTVGGGSSVDDHGAEPHGHDGGPSSAWWLAVVAVGALCVMLWVKGNKQG